MKRLSIFLLPCLLAGCAINPYNQFYQDFTAQRSVEERQRLLPPSPEPQIEAVSIENVDEVNRHTYEHGFVMIGAASFAGRMYGEDKLREKAKAVGADVVLYNAGYLNSQQTVLALPSYQSGQSYTTQHNGVVSGPGLGYGTYSGTSTTTTPGTWSTQYVPYQVDVYRQSATFWRRCKTVLGANCLSLPDDLRVKLQQNGGVYVDAVVEGSPAFKANLMRGDVILELDGTTVSTIQDFHDSIKSRAGRKITLKVVRGDRTIRLEGQLNDIHGNAPA
jgi:membrane-associated protease RseP (regulator of RpoE activity)